MASLGQVNDWYHDWHVTWHILNNIYICWKMIYQTVIKHLQKINLLKVFSSSWLPNVRIKEYIIQFSII